jgi:serine protease AprX
MAEGNERPIRVVEIRTSDHIPPSGGGAKKLFGEVTAEVRESLLESFNIVEQAVFSSFEKWPNIPGVAKVTLKEEALAKSHRPLSLFTPTSCPIIGTKELGELLIGVTPSGLHEVKRRVTEGDTNSLTANISAIEKVEPYFPESIWDEGIAKRIRQSIHEGVPLKLRLFNHHEETTNLRIARTLREFATSLDLEYEELSYPGVDQLYVARKINDHQLAEVERFIGLQSLSPMPYFKANDFSIQMSPIATAPIDAIDPPEPDVEYPIVGVIDSGICDDTPSLQPWIYDREYYVPATDIDTRHGTMVGGLIAGAHKLNHSDPRFPECSAMLLDVAVFPASGKVSEEDLIASISDVIPKYPQVSIWNLSIGEQSPSPSDEFSDFARFLDEMHDEHGSTFIVASGNHNLVQGWPQTLDFAGQDRVSSPGDTVRGLTVGSIANTEKPDSLVKSEEPSPFSRRGPGPCFTPKPEVSHYGGNCNASLQCAQMGVLSVGPGNNVMESVGTSFATPIVSAQAASIWQALQNTETAPTSEKVKALLIHSALLTSPQVTSNSINHYGFGKPAEPIDVLHCSENSLTLMFDVELRGSYIFERWPFPVPASLKTDEGKFSGEILITLVYSPPVDSSFASEYCRTNVELSLGSYDVNPETGKAEHRGKVPLAPTDIRHLYEKHRIEHGFKWSPVKAYRAIFPRGTAVDTWRFTMSATQRAESFEANAPQRAIALVTLRSGDPSSQVYDEGVEIMDQSNWVSIPITQPIRIEVE